MKKLKFANWISPEIYPLPKSDLFIAFSSLQIKKQIKNIYEYKIIGKVLLISEI